MIQMVHRDPHILKIMHFKSFFIYHALDSCRTNCFSTIEQMRPLDKRCISV